MTLESLQEREREVSDGEGYTFSDLLAPILMLSICFVGLLRQVTQQGHPASWDDHQGSWYRNAFYSSVDVGVIFS